MFDVSVNVRVYDFCLLMCHVLNVNIKLVNKLQSFCRLHLFTYNIFANQSKVECMTDSVCCLPPLYDRHENFDKMIKFS